MFNIETYLIVESGGKEFLYSNTNNQEYINI